MPYKDPEQKKQWERLHRPERLARRREQRRATPLSQSRCAKVPRVISEFLRCGYRRSQGQRWLPTVQKPEWQLVARPWFLPLSGKRDGCGGLWGASF